MSSYVFSVPGIPNQQVYNSGQPDNHTETTAGSDAEEDSDLDSALGLDRRDSTITLTSEVLKPIEKHGREYHSFQEGKYLLPNDKQERERLDLQHEVFRRTFRGRLHLVRLLKTHRVLDMGTGTGIWAITFDNHLDAEVYGIDLSPIQPMWVPPNCVFQIADLLHPWNFQYQFDFIHGRMLFCSFPDPLYIFKEAFKALAIGGVLEMQDVIFEFRSFDESLKGSALEDWSKRLKEAFGSKGIDLTCASKYKNFLETAGFEDIKEKEFFWPMGAWPKKQHLKTLGRWCQTNILDMLHAISIVPLTEPGPHRMSIPALEVLLARVRQDLQDPRIHAYLQILVVHGRKPRPNIFTELET